MQRPSMHSVDFNRAPFLLIWEATQACALACQHCRAEAMDRRDPRELSLEEGRRLISDTAAMGTPIFIFSGGDPFQRQDLEDLIRHAKTSGLRVGVIPAATPRLTKERIESIKAAGVDQIALSIDRSTAAGHDNFRGVAGSFEKTLEGARYVREAGVPLQINTCFGQWNIGEFDALTKLVESLGTVFWEVFLLVPVGRGAAITGLSADQTEDLFKKLYALQKRVKFIVKVTEAPHYRRFVAEQERSAHASGPTGERIRDLLARPAGPGGSMGMSPHAVNAGKGFCFVSHTGEVFPSGYLPICAGNVRERTVTDIYRNSPLFQQLRNPALLKGRCGYCEYRELCGGSRSRAFAVTGDPFETEPSCAYEPRSARVSPAPAATP